MKDIIIVTPARLGDTIFCTPAIRLLKACRPFANIDVIAVSALSASVLENNPHIRQVFVAPTIESVETMAGDYQVGINMHNTPAAREYFAAMEIDPITLGDTDLTQPQAEQILGFFQSFLSCDLDAVHRKYCLHPRVENIEKIKALIDERVKPDDILIGCHLGCHGLSKRGWKWWKSLEHNKVWSLDRFIALEAKLRQHDPRIRFVITGSKGEQALGKKFEKASKHVINLTGMTSVLDLAALMQRLSLYLSSDTGAMHVACAMDVALVALFGPTWLARTGPYPMQDNYTVLQAKSMSDISVDEVYRAICKHTLL